MIRHGRRSDSGTLRPEERPFYARSEWRIMDQRNFAEMQRQRRQGGTPVTSSAEGHTPKCPECNARTYLTRVLPTVLPKKCGTETYVYACPNCGTTITRTVRDPHHSGDQSEPIC
jgi:predicted RNA-binding Zn-ribbon protein involved in translation (DUF1610 family)